MERYTLPLSPISHSHSHSHTLPWTQPQLHHHAPSWTAPNSQPKPHIPIPIPEPEPEPEPDCYFNSAISIPFLPNPTTSTDNFLMHHHHHPTIDSFPLHPSPSPSPSLPLFNNFDTSFDLGLDGAFLLGNHSSNSHLLMGFSQAHMAPDLSELEALASAPAHALKPLEPQPTLFQKRRGSVEIPGLETVRRKGRKWEEGEGEDGNCVVDVDAASGLHYDSDEPNEMNGNGLNPSECVTVTGGGDHKGKRKGLPAKNLMAERRRRKKLNDRLYMLRSVVPKISKV